MLKDIDSFPLVAVLCEWKQILPYNVEQKKIKKWFSFKLSLFGNL